MVRRQMAGVMAAGAMLLGATGVGAADKAPPKPALQPAKASDAALKAKVADMAARYATPDKRPKLDEIVALKAELEAAGIPDAADYADLSLIHAYTLAFARDFDTALTVVAKAEDVVKTAMSRPGATPLTESKLGDLYLLHAQLLDQKGLLDDGLALKREARALYLRLEGPESPMGATILSQIAFSTLAGGNLTEAINLYDQALPRMAVNDGVVRPYVTQSANYALALRLAGEYERALRVSRDALDVARVKMPAGHLGTLTAMNTMGATLIDMGRLTEAEVVLREGFDLATKHRGAKSIDTAGFAYRLGQVSRLSGDEAAALTFFNTALAAMEGVSSGPNPDLPGLVRLELARLCGDAAADKAGLICAETHLRAGVSALEGAGKTADTTRSRLKVELARVRLIRGAPAEALTLTDEALVYYRVAMPPAAPDRVNAEMLRALILVRLGRTADAFEQARATEAVMTARLLEGGAERNEPSEIANAYSLNYARYGHIALAAGYRDEAFRAAQLAAFSEVAATAQALAVRAMLNDPRATGLLSRLQAAERRYHKLDRDRTYALSKSASNPAAARVAEALIPDINAAAAELVAAREALKALSPVYETLRRPRPQSIEEARAGLSPGQAVLMPLVADDAVLTLALTRDALLSDTVAISQIVVGQKVHQVRLSLEAGLRNPDAAFDRQAGYVLGVAVLPPSLRQKLGGVKAVQVMGAGPLMTLPFSLLVLDPPKGRDEDPAALRGTAFLIKRYAVSVRPVFSVAARTESLAVKGFAGIGAPLLGPSGDLLADLRGSPYALRGESEARGGDDDYRGNLADVTVLKTLPSLPEAAQELSTMAAILKSGKTLLLVGKDATEARVKAAALTDYGVIAFATHGLIGSETGRVGEPALVLTPPEVASEADDGLLTATEVSLLRLNAEWVILSACNTGSARETGGAGYSGLAQAFMQAGARNLLVSLWPVRDDAAAKLSVGTLKANAAGLSKPEALRKATLDLLKDKNVPPHPALWAPFSLISR
ncbi:CHAT domain-containing protein [Asticcacaulis sp. BYS171W]|uniref:CHAT domain-containing protein n=1 Tax=Asticcacaulis aquaticus TaxID=2984212 RepID=A0ABT5HVW4_9CAUL|nr:CHAT domain-containing protein [Asticcacaulis aquaticus]MDC7684220.1 CHAT domain-containing protein [Asticcacaulis aquaticus]